MRFSSFGLLFAVCAAVGCSSSGSGSAFTPTDDGGPSGGSGPGDDAGGGLGGGPIDGSLGTVNDAGVVTGKTLLYAHDGKTLYQIDPTDPTLAVAAVGKFDCIGDGGASSMTDIAVDQGANLFGVATDTLFLDMKIVAGGVACSQAATPIVTGGNANAKFYGQSFAPKGTLDPNKETLLVGNSLGEMYAVDTSTGALTIVGTFGTVPANGNDGNGNTYPSDAKGGGAGTTFQMSGDIVFLANGGSPIGFATVRDCKSASTCSAVDTLIEIDMTKLALGNTGSVQKSVRGQVRKSATCADANNTTYGAMYGIAAFEDKVIGFSNQGFIVSIDNTDGTACLVHDYSSAPIRFDGAGVTTSAPVKAPPPK